ncbi:hypothetical protein PRZ61_10775 [Halomonas pacifica]|uniref:DUF968 domain-containing protein n=1 Tax=Bisbaumannia pacifica TaxID=77098 RepID=UPI00235904D7|nr:hypothetical protein [Halomonas pacifica]MDC8803919.1 hypothetical protein [Halomonas pacifica]
MKRTGPIKRKTPLKARQPMRRAKPNAQSNAQNSQKGRHKVQKVAQKAPARWRSPEYLAFVRMLPCCVCGAPADDAHHVIGLHWGLSGMGTTAPDSYAMPVCRSCHQDIHRLPELQRCQPGWLRHTISRGMREFKGDIREALVQAWRFIESKEAA